MEDARSCIGMQTLKHGDVREDGRIFWGFNKGREEWKTPESFERAKKRITVDKQRRRHLAGSMLGFYKSIYRGGCMVCGEKDPVCLSFHHINSDKDFNVSDRLGGSLVSLMNEAIKCVILCHNCHAKFHAQEREPCLLETTKQKVTNAETKDEKVSILFEFLSEVYCRADMKEHLQQVKESWENKYGVTL